MKAKNKKTTMYPCWRMNFLPVQIHQLLRLLLIKLFLHPNESYRLLLPSTVGLTSTFTFDRRVRFNHYYHHHQQQRWGQRQQHQPRMPLITTMQNTYGDSSSDETNPKKKRKRTFFEDDINDNRIPNEGQADFSGVLESSSIYFYDEHKPRREYQKNSSSQTAAGYNRRSPLRSWMNDINPWDDWGVERLDVSWPAAKNDNTVDNMASYSVVSGPTQFPDTYDTVASAIVETCAAVLYNQAALDPNIVQNAYVGSDDIYRRRPIQQYPKDAGRIGIEIDGAAYLLSTSETTSLSTRREVHNNEASLLSSQQQQQRMRKPSTKLADEREIETNSIALRRLALVIAGKLSQKPWDGYYKEEDTSGTTNRPIIVVFNSVKHALIASRELQRLQYSERITKESSCYNPASTKYDNITLISLQDDIPTDIFKKVSNNNKHRSSKYVSSIDPTKGVVIIVQPTDYNNQEEPAGPIFNALTDVQRIVATATLLNVPVIMLSPRFVQYRVGGDQSGYQQSSVYGGYEPPDGPTPWILRDFTPPAFCWIGNALPVTSSSSYQFTDPSKRRSSYYNSNQQQQYHCAYSRLSLLQSVLYPGHSWNLFAAKECWFVPDEYNTADQKEQHKNKQSTMYPRTVSSSSYEYICTTKKATGRPTRNLMRRLFYEFASYEC